MITDTREGIFIERGSQRPTCYESNSPIDPMSEVDWAYRKLQIMAEKGIHFMVTDKNGMHHFQLQQENGPTFNSSRFMIYECWAKGFTEGVDMLWKKAKELYGDFDKECPKS